MADRYVFSDEAGNFDLSRGSGASRYFILGTVTADDCRIGDELLQLRRELGWRGVHLDKVFHATEDPQAVRDEVFDVLSHGNFRIDATILEKSKGSSPSARASSSLQDGLVPALQTCCPCGREQEGSSVRRRI